MIYVGIDVASAKHDVAILGSNGEELCDVFTIPNNRSGFNTLISKLSLFEKDFSQIKIGLESTGHYSQAITHFVRAKRQRDKSLSVTVFNPLVVNRIRKAQTLRRTKTDKADAKFLAVLVMTDDSKPVMESVPQIDELKTLTRHRHRLVKERGQHKQQISRLITIVFPELSSLFSTTSLKTVQALLLEFPSAEKLANAHITKLTNLLYSSSKHRFGREKAMEIREVARQSVGVSNRGTEFELVQHLQSLSFLTKQIDELEKEIAVIMLEIDSPILTIPGIGITLGAMIIAEIGNIQNFANPAKLLAFSGLEPSQWQSGKFTATATSMVKHGSKHLRYAFIQAAMSVSRFNPVFKAYSEKKLAENKHYYVVMSHVAKKLLRVIFHLLKDDVKFDLAKAA